MPTSSEYQPVMYKVLMILYYSPPLGGIGTLRSLGHVKYLPALGWQPHVLTVKNGSEADVRDPSLLERIPGNVSVTRTRFLDLNRVVCWPSHIPLSKIAQAVRQFWSGFPPDRCVGWLPFAYRQGRKIIASEKVDAIYTLSAPYTAHVVGHMLKRATGLPWVADFGDEWTQNPFYPLRYGWQSRLNCWMEKRVLEAADHVIVAWPGIVELLSPMIRNKTTTITCCFDEDDFKEPIVSHRDKFRITYTGSFYAAQQPGNFLLALHKLLEDGRIPVDKVELVFVGQTRTAGFVDFEGTILDKVTRRMGFVHHQKAVQYLRDSDVLLLIVTRERGKEDIPGKTFEYLASGRPVLALVPSDGATASLIRKARAGTVVDPEDIKAIKEAVLYLYKQWKRGELEIQPDWTEIRKYEAKVVTGSLVEVLDSLLP